VILRRLAEQDREPIEIFIDQRRVDALRGDTVLTAMLLQSNRLRTSEFGGEPRAGFCLMGACQDCWVTTETGERFRSCSTFVRPGMRLLTGRHTTDGIQDCAPADDAAHGPSASSTDAVQPVIVGAGPAGIRAAQALVAHGLRPVIVDEGVTSGGQIYRQQPGNFRREAEALYGLEAPRARAVHAAMAALEPRVDYRPRTLVWNAEEGHLDLLCDGRTSRLPYTHLIVASGAADRVLPPPGWTKPGVFTLGGAQVALKFQGCAIGTAVVIAGTGPLLYLVACQYAKAGAKVAAVLDLASFGQKARATPAMLSQPAVLAKGLYYAAWLRLHGVPVHDGARLLRVMGDDRVTGVAWHDGTRERASDCDAIAIGHGLRPETQLADLLGCEFRFDELSRAYVPQRDAAGRTSVAGVYVAGDGAGILGADAAEWAGERAAFTLLEDAGIAFEKQRALELERRLARTTKFRRGLERAFSLPHDWAAQAPADLVICRCEEVTAGELRAAVRDAGVIEINRLKALTRVGMGRCQGRTCGAAAAEVLAHACGREVDQVGRLRAQAPLKPIPFGAQP
jgi:hydrogen cyanide synthase HcnB